jgi:hypothetical protein
MAKAKEPAKETKETFVDTEQSGDFSDAADPVREASPRGSDLQGEIEAVRATRAAQRSARGKTGKRRKITHYQDAERLKNLGLLTPEEHVDCEEEGLFFDAAQYATRNTEIDSSPPDEA